MKSSLSFRQEANAFLFVSQCMSKQLTPLVTIRPFQHISHPQQRRHKSSKRQLHSSSSRDTAIPAPITYSSAQVASSPPSLEAITTKTAPLAALPLSSVLRTYFVTSISSSPFLLRTSTNLLRRMLESTNPLFRIDKNPLLRLLLWETFYKQFCAGATAPEIARICAELRSQGYAGVILEYALEVLKDADTNEAADIATWRAGMLASVDMSAPGDFVGLKWSGMGPAAMRRMKDQQAPTEAMDEAMHAVCRAAQAKRIALLPAAEETWNLAGYHAWTLALQRVYNAPSGTSSVIYNTYQAYLRQTPQVLAEHLQLAKREKFTLGIKLVRGAYLASEPPKLLWPSIETTHHAYDQIMTALIQRRHNDFFQPAAAASATAEKDSATFPALNVVIASHNAASVSLALRLRAAQRAATAPASENKTATANVNGESTSLTPLVFAQLQGMADEVSCALIAASKAMDNSSENVSVDTVAKATTATTGPTERVFKCTTWGSMFECLNYLLRRAAENKDAAGRTVDTRKAMGKELRRRVLATVGLA